MEKTARVTFPDGRVARITGTEENITSFLEGLPDVQNPSNYLSTTKEPPMRKNRPNQAWSAISDFIESQRGANIIGGIPINRQEVSDIPRVLARQIPGVRGYSVDPIMKAPFDPPGALRDLGLSMGASLIGKRGSDLDVKELVKPPQTDYGKNLETGADLLPMVAISGKMIGDSRIKKLGPELPAREDILKAKESIQSKIKELPGAESKFREWSSSINRQNKEQLASLRRNEISGIKKGIESVDSEAQKMSADLADSGRSKYWEFYKGLLNDFKKELDKSGFTKNKVEVRKGADILQSVVDDLGISEKPISDLSQSESAVLNKLKELRGMESSGEDIVDPLTNAVVSRKTSNMMTGNDIWDFLKKQTSNDPSDPVVNRIYKSLSKEFPNFSKVRSMFKEHYQDANELRRIFDIKTSSKSGDVNINRPFDFIYKLARGKSDEADNRIIQAVERRFGAGFFDKVKGVSSKFSDLTDKQKRMVENYARKVSDINNQSMLSKEKFNSLVSGKRQELEPQVSALNALEEFLRSKEASKQKIWDNLKKTEIVGAGIGLGTLGINKIKQLIKK